MIAEILVAIYGYFYQYSLLRLTLTMLAVLLIFFVIGSILQGMSNRLFAELEEKAAREREEEEERKKAEQALQEEEPEAEQKQAI